VEQWGSLGARRPTGQLHLAKVRQRKKLDKEIYFQKESREEARDEGRIPPVKVNKSFLPSKKN